MQPCYKADASVLRLLEKHVIAFIRNYLIVQEPSAKVDIYPAASEATKQQPHGSIPSEHADPPHRSQRSSITALRTTYMASIAHSHIQEKRLVTKRDIYYMCRPLFPNPAGVDRALALLSEETQIIRNDLNIVAAPRGIVSGNISFIEEGGHVVDVGKFGCDGCLVPPRPERMDEIVTAASAIVM